MVEEQPLEVRQVSEFFRYRPSETVVIEVQLREVRQVSEFFRYRPSETVAIEVQLREVRQVSEFFRYRPSETVAIEAQPLEVRQVSEFFRYRPRESVASDGQLREVGQVTEFGRQCAVQRVRRGRKRDDDLCDALGGSSKLDSVPARYRSRRVPVEGAGPAEGISQPPESIAIRDEPGVRRRIWDGGAVSAFGERRLAGDVEQ